MGEAPIITLRNSSKEHTVRYLLEKNVEVRWPIHREICYSTAEIDQVQERSLRNTPVVGEECRSLEVRELDG